PARRPPARRGLAAGPVHDLLRRALHPARHADRPGRHRQPGHRPRLSRCTGHPGRCAGTLAVLLDVLAQDRAHPAPDAWQREARELGAGREARLLADAGLDVTPIKPQRVYAELRRALPPDTIVTLDAGAAPAYGYDRLRFTRPRTFLTPLD